MFYFDGYLLMVSNTVYKECFCCQKQYVMLSWVGGFQLLNNLKILFTFECFASSSDKKQSLIFRIITTIFEVYLYTFCKYDTVDQSMVFQNRDRANS